MLSFTEFLLEAPAEIGGSDAVDIKNQMTSFISDANKPTSNAYKSIRKSVKPIGEGYYTTRKGNGYELYHVTGNSIDIMAYLTIERYPLLGKVISLESIAKVNDSVYIDNNLFMNKILLIRDMAGAQTVISDKFHTQGANHLWIKMLAIARNNDREIGVYNTSNNKKLPITSQSIPIALRKGGYLSNQSVVMYFK